jgi:hypothetical protein
MKTTILTIAGLLTAFGIGFYSNAFTKEPAAVHTSISNQAILEELKLGAFSVNILPGI